MSERGDSFFESLRDRLHAIESRLESVKTNVDKAGQETEATIKAKLDEARTKVEQSKRDAEDARAKVAAYIERKTFETEAKIEAWKKERELKELDSRAERAEEYAESTILLALSPVEEAEVATLEAIAARRDFEEAKSAP